MSNLYDSYDAYFKSLQEIYGKSQGTTEMSGRSALEALLNAVKNNVDKSCRIIQEPASERGASPDFKVTRSINIIGYIENKKLDSDLEKIINLPQIRLYHKLSGNTLVTNYHEWVWIKGDLPPQRVKLFSVQELKKSKVKLSHEKIDKLQRILEGFLNVKPEPISDIKEIAEALAVRTKHLKIYIEKSLKEHEEGKLHGLYEAIVGELLPQLKQAEFADTYAQMLSYGLFMARVSKSGQEILTLENAESKIPDSFSLMQELVSFLRELGKKEYAEIRWVVEEILYIINSMDREAIVSTLSFEGRKSRVGLSKSKNNNDLLEQDPFIYFYEYFLAAYDKALRKSRGVYYTPPQVVNFIVRALDNVLKDKFKIDNGFANHEEVKVLDFACGTGTFLLEIFKQIFNSIGAETANDGAAKAMIKDHLLKNIYGFEYLIAAYTIAHLKLSQYLKDKGYEFGDKERLKVFLTNTLDNIEDIGSRRRNLLLPTLSDEARRGQEIKDDTPILVITGNPPYAGHSLNISRTSQGLTWIGEKIEDYKKINGEEIKEQQIKWLQDDYVKFIRFAQDKIEKTGKGAIGIITNHGFIDNPTFRGMRHSLMQTFEQIYILDLHGNARKKEKTPDGGKDENVFDIQQGVSISFFIKNKGLKRGIFHADLWGDRDYKYKWTLENDFNSIDWREIKPKAPYFFFIQQDSKIEEEYYKAWSLQDIFNTSSVGIVTARDELTIKFTKKEIKETVEKFSSISVKKAREEFNLRNDNSNWSVEEAQNDIKESGQSDEMFQPILYRVFDERFTYYTGNSNGFFSRPMNKVMGHMLEDNLALITVRQLATMDNWFHAWVSDKLTEGCAISNRGREINHIFPLYLYKDRIANFCNGNGRQFNLVSDDLSRVDNFRVEFKKQIAEKYGDGIFAEDVFYYIYAIFHCSLYRSYYEEFLCRDFPRIPFCENKDVFISLAKLGKKMVDLHLMKSQISRQNFLQGAGKNNTIKDINYDQKAERLYINDEKYFDSISTSVWDFRIGGYRALEKYLKTQKGRLLNLNEKELNMDQISHIGKIIHVIQETIKLMKEIDQLVAEDFSHWQEK